MIEATLRADGQFLSLSRTQAHQFDVPVSFTLNNGTLVEVPGAGIIQFTPAKAGDKDIVLSCGVHGNETAPIEICDEMVQNILAEKLMLAHRVLFLFGNLPAMDIGERFVEENMNRLFCGAHSEGGIDNAERRRAAELEASVTAFYGQDSGRTRFHYDLHTAIRASKNEKFAVYPFLHGKPRNREQLQIMLACGVATILLSESPTTTFSYYSSVTHNAHAFTVELGKVRPFGQNDMRKFAQVRETLNRLVSQVDLDVSDYSLDDCLLYRVNQVINRNFEDFSLTFADDTPNFTDYPKGHVLAEEPGTRYRCEFDGEAIVFPNANVALGQRALLTVIPAELD